MSKSIYRNKRIFIVDEVTLSPWLQSFYLEALTQRSAPESIKIEDPKKIQYGPQRNSRKGKKKRW